MKKNIAFTEHARWISYLLLAYLITACGTLELHVERPYQMKDGTPANTKSAHLTAATRLPISTKSALPSNTISPSNTPYPTQTSTAISSYTPTARPRSIRPPGPIPHFSPGESITITQIEMFDAITGWAVARDEEFSADHILTTSDGGYSWSDVTPSEPVPQEIDEYTYKYASVFFQDGQRAYVIYDPKEYGDPARIWSTSSAGSQWKTLTIDTSFQSVEYLTFTEGTQGWVMLGVDAGMGHAWIELYQINTQAQQWDLLIDPYSENSADLHYCCKTDMIFHGTDTGLVTFGRGPMGGAFINWSRDGGLNWESHPLPRPEGYLEDLGDENWGYLCESHSPILFSSELGKVALECWENTDRSDISSFIYTTTDRGINWFPETYPGGQMLFLNEDIGWALSNNLFQTLDGGETWTKLSRVNWGGQFSFINQQLGWAVARDREEFALVYTEDAGKTWDIIEPVVVE